MNNSNLGFCLVSSFDQFSFFNVIYKNLLNGGILFGYHVEDTKRMECQRCVEIDKESAARQASSSDILGKEHFYCPSSPSLSSP